MLSVVFKVQPILLVKAFNGTIRIALYILIFKIKISSDWIHEGKNSIFVLNQITQRKLTKYLPFNHEWPFDDFNYSSF